MPAQPIQVHADELADAILAEGAVAIVLVDDDVDEVRIFAVGRLHASTLRAADRLLRLLLGVTDPRAYSRAASTLRRVLDGVRPS